MSNGRNGSLPSAARRLRKSSNIVFQHLAWILAVEVRTPSRSNRTASKLSGVIGLCGGLTVVAPWIEPVGGRTDPKQRLFLVAAAERGFALSREHRPPLTRCPL